MYTAVLIRRHINNIISDKPFSIRDFLNYGSRNAVDQVFYRLVKSGQIIRIARGLFIKDGSPIPSIVEVARTKAAAFGKKLITHGWQAAMQLGLSSQSDKIIFACDGPSSSFRFGEKCIYFVNTIPRKLHLGDEPVGLATRALWYLGKTMCSPLLVGIAVSSFNRSDREHLRQSRKIMPAWLSNYFASMRNL